MTGTLALTLALLASPAGPHLYFEQTTFVYVEGEAAGPGVKTRAWHAGRRMRLEAGDAPGGPDQFADIARNRAGQKKRQCNHDDHYRNEDETGKSELPVDTFEHRVFHGQRFGHDIFFGNDQYQGRSALIDVAVCQ